MRRKRHDVDPAEQPADLARRERAFELDDAAPVERSQVLGEALRHLAEDPDSQSGLASAARPGPAAGVPCADRPSPRNATVRFSPTRPGRRSRPTWSQISSSCGIAWRTTSTRSAGYPDASSVLRTLADTARIAVRPRSARARISASRRWWPSTSVLPTQLAQLPPPSPGPSHIEPAPVSRYSAWAHQPVVVRREVGR